MIFYWRDSVVQTIPEHGDQFLSRDLKIIELISRLHLRCDICVETCRSIVEVYYTDIFITIIRKLCEPIKA